MTSGEPAMSVVIPAVRAGTLLRECLAALGPQAEALRLEILVVSRLPAGQAEAITSAFPRARAIPAGGETIPLLRARGLKEAAAPLVAVLGEHVRPGPDWASSMLRGHAADAEAAAVGGPISPRKGDGPAARAAFLSEYSAHIKPIPDEHAFSPAGINVSYKRSAIEACGGLFFEGLWETLLHEALERKGFRFRYEAGAEVIVTRSFRFFPFLVEKWRIARSYAGMRAARIAWPGRLVRAAATALLPALLTSRIFRRVLERRGAAGALGLLPVLPFLFADVAAWTLGEFLGYLSGEGRSTERIA